MRAAGVPARIAADGSSRQWRGLARWLCVTALLTGPLHGDSGQTAAASDSVTAYETKHYPILTFPQTIWNYFVYPVGQFTIYAEHTELPQRVNDWFTNADQTFGIFPQVQLGGETSTGAAVRLFHTDLFEREKMLDAFYVFSNSNR